MNSLNKNTASIQINRNLQLIHALHAKVQTNHEKIANIQIDDSHI